MKKYFGDWKFYKKLLWLAVPIIIQNAITNFVGLLDNIMVGSLGTEQMSGVAIVNQLFFVFSLLVFGGLSGVSIFGAQFYGNRDYEGVRNAFRFKVIIGILIAAVSFLTFGIGGNQLIQLYLTAGEGGNRAQTLLSGNEYLAIAMLEIIPFIVVQIYASTLRETGETMIPMLAGIMAVIVNLSLNFILIYGNFGAPKMGVAGAALATVISRIVECMIVITWTHKNTEKNIFIVGVYHTLKIPFSLAKKIVIKGTPLMLNEAFWAAGVAMINQCYSVRGLHVIAAVNIASTINNLFNVVFISLGSAVAILVGQHLGANEFEKAKDTARKVIMFSVLLNVGLGIILYFMGDIFPKLYNTSDEIRTLAKRMIEIVAVMLPIQAYLNAVYFTIRSGGRTVITFFFDSGYSWGVTIPLIYIMVHFTNMDILKIYIIFYSMDIIKSLIGHILYKKEIWIRNIVEENEAI